MPLQRMLLRVQVGCSGVKRWVCGARPPVCYSLPAAAAAQPRPTHSSVLHTPNPVPASLGLPPAPAVINITVRRGLPFEGTQGPAPGPRYAPSRLWALHTCPGARFCTYQQACTPTGAPPAALVLPPSPANTPLPGGSLPPRQVFITAQHGGRHAFRICPSDVATARCFEQHPLER